MSSRTFGKILWEQMQANNSISKVEKLSEALIIVWLTDHNDISRITHFFIIFKTLKYKKDL